MSNGFLHKYFLNNPNKLINKWINYFDIYERHFSRFVDKKMVIIEIGVAGGGSLAMWKEFFGKKCTVIGIDINPKCKNHEADGIEVFIGSQDDPALIEQIFENYPEVDIVIDDGSHKMNHIISSFELLYERLQPNGIYLVEDTHTSYWKEYGGGVKQNGSFIEFVKNKMDELNASHTRDVLPISTFTKSTDYIACYDSIVVFERRPQGKRQYLMTAKM